MVSGKAWRRSARRHIPLVWMACLALLGIAALGLLALWALPTCSPGTRPRGGVSSASVF
jgi:hypothetical protein